MLVTFFKTGESPRKFGYDGVTDLQVDREGTATVSGIDKFDNSGYMIFVRPVEYSYFTLHKEGKEDE